MHHTPFGFPGPREGERGGRKRAGREIRERGKRE